MFPALVWTRQRSGLYTCGHWTIERIDQRYRPRWRLTSLDDCGWSEDFGSLHAAQNAAAGRSVREPLFTHVAVRRPRPALTLPRRDWLRPGVFPDWYELE